MTMQMRQHLRNERWSQFNEYTLFFFLHFVISGQGQHMYIFKMGITYKYEYRIIGLLWLSVLLLRIDGVEYWTII